VVRDGDGAVRIVARKPLSTMSAARAGKVLGCSAWTVRKLFRLGFLKGYKPGAAAKRRDRRASNAALVLDSESVLRYKAEREREARKYQETVEW